MGHSHRNVMVDLARRHGWQRGAELGLGHGHMLEMMLAANPSIHMIGVDFMAVPERAELCRGIAKRYADRCTLYEMRTHDAAKLVQDESLDFIFIDANHNYEFVKDDIAMWSPKVRMGGCVAGHDYNEGKFPGVIKAVKEAFGRVKLLDHHVWLTWK